MLLTLGLTETWLDQQTGVPMNVHRGPDWLRKLGQRLHFVDYGFSETLEQLRELVALVHKHCSSEIKFVVTVSPVPLHYTFKHADLLVAHTASKSLLRAVAEEIVREHPLVDYFPSFEIANLSPRDAVFQSDLIHVSDEAVDFITARFCETYYN